jgi:DNA uptake protein ComE-like DNA-binding protein
MDAEQAIEGAARYVGYALANYGTNGAVPQNTQFSCENVPIGDSHFWIIGRDPSVTPSTTEPYFALIDEGSKLNMNRVGTNTLSYLPNMDYDVAQDIVDWRTTNGTPDLTYAQYGYTEKQAPFETLDELRLIDGVTADILAGDDRNRNGVLDADEKDTSGTGQVQFGLLEYLTAYSREPNFHSDGSILTNVNTATQSTLTTLFQNASLSGSTALAGKIAPATGRPTFTSLLNFYLFCQAQNGMTSAQFATIYNNITISASVVNNTNTFILGRLNINTASAAAMTALFEGATGGQVDEQTAESAAQTLVTYREQNPNELDSVAWMVDALGKSSPVVTQLASRDVITTHSYQFTADIAAVGPYGRGYRRVKFVFDTTGGVPVIVYRQDLSRLGWALGKKARETLVAKETK